MGRVAVCIVEAPISQRIPNEVPEARRATDLHVADACQVHQTTEQLEDNDPLPKMRPETQALALSLRGILQEVVDKAFEIDGT